jgi:hypothetical protein
MASAKNEAVMEQIFQQAQNLKAQSDVVRSKAEAPAHCQTPYWDYINRNTNHAYKPIWRSPVPKHSAMPQQDYFKMNPQGLTTGVVSPHSTSPGDFCVDAKMLRCENYPPISHNDPMIELPYLMEKTLGTAADPFGAHEVGVEADAQWHNVTTVVMRNLSHTCTQDMIISELRSACFEGLYDFLYLPRQKKKITCRGYAFINFVNVYVATLFRRLHDGKEMGQLTLGRQISISPAFVQGRESNNLRLPPSLTSELLNENVENTASTTPGSNYEEDSLVSEIAHSQQNDDEYHGVHRPEAPTEVASPTSHLPAGKELIRFSF